MSAGQKSGVVHALDPDQEGKILWQDRVGKGGINGGVQWGSAADGSNVYVALSDLGRIPVPNSQATIPDPEAGGGMFAMSLENGKRVWETPAPRACKNRDRCSPAQSAAVSAIPGVVSCSVIFADGLILAGNIPNEMHMEGLSAVAPAMLKKLQQHMCETQLGPLSCMTVHGEKSPVTFFGAGDLCLTAVHNGAELSAESRRELGRITQELSRTYPQVETPHVDH